MPFPTNADVPPDVKRRFSGHCLTVWREVFNQTLERDSDEGRAFATAEKAGQQCTEAEMPKTNKTARAVHAVKFVDGSDNIIEGLGVPFGGPFGGKDLDGESFGPDTDLALEWFPEEGRPVIYHHGLDSDMKTALVGRQIERAAQDAGHWVKVQLDKRNRYFETIAQMVRDGLLSFSSGSLGHLVEVEKDGQIKSWPWVELSLTPTPANPDAMVYAVKASDAIEHIASVPGTEVPAPLKAAVDAIADGFTEPTQEGDSEPEPLAVHSERVSREVKAWVERLTTRVEARNREERKPLSEPTVEAMKSAHETITALLADIDRPSEQEAEAELQSLALALQLTA